MSAWLNRAIGLAAGGVLVGGLVAAALGSNRRADPVAVSTPTARHLVLVVFDTLRADRMSIYGHDRPTTPFLESRSGEMVRFEGAAAPAPWTVPTHASLFTGLWPGEHRAQWGNIEVADELVTLAEDLREHGFCTVGLTANGFIGPQYGFAQGFDEYRVFHGSDRTRAERILEKLDETLERNTSGCERMFVFLNFRDTHIPYNHHRHGQAFGLRGEPPVVNSQQKWRVSAGQWRLTEAQKQRHRMAYDAAVRFLDDIAKDLFTQLEAHGILDDSAVVLTSDHGDGLAYHPELGHSITVWEEQLAVPLLVRFPRGARGGEVVEGRHTLVSVTPSAFDWLGLGRPRHLVERPSLESGAAPVTAGCRSYFADGQRQLNANLAERYPDLAERTVHSHVLYCGDHKLVVEADGDTHLYDLLADPTEQRDLAEADPEALRPCREEYERLAQGNLYTPFADASTQEVTEADLELLRSLGYVE